MSRSSGKFLFCPKIFIFVRKFLLLSENFDFCPKFGFCPKISIFVQKVRFLSTNFDLCPKIYFFSPPILFYFSPRSKGRKKVEWNHMLMQKYNYVSSNGELDGLDENDYESLRVKARKMEKSNGGSLTNGGLAAIAYNYTPIVSSSDSPTMVNAVRNSTVNFTPSSSEIITPTLLPDTPTFTASTLSGLLTGNVSL